MISLLAGIAALITCLIVRTHPEPDDPDAKPPYVAVMGAAPSAVLVACSMVVGCWGSATLAAWGSAGLVLCWVDLRTTWLPSRATAFAAVCVAAGLVADAAASGSPARAIHGLAGAATGYALFLVIWIVSRSFGYGDVRLAGLLGAVTGSCGLGAWLTGLFLGTLASALFGLATMWWRRHHPHPLGAAFAYGPGLWLGGFVGALVG